MIEIYAYEPSPSGALQPVRLHAVAPLEQKDQVDVWCAQMNKEAEEARVSRRFKYVIGTSELWK